jgi:hypothetical protein
MSSGASSRVFDIYSGVFDISFVVCSIVSPIPNCGVARSRLEASVYALVGCHRTSFFLPQPASSSFLALC